MCIGFRHAVTNKRKGLNKCTVQWCDLILYQFSNSIEKFARYLSCSFHFGKLCFFVFQYNIEKYKKNDKEYTNQMEHIVQKNHAAKVTKKQKNRVTKNVMNKIYILQDF